jgi:flagellar hook-associated protein 2
VGGQPAHAIDGSTTFAIELGEHDTLEDLVTKINELGAGATASVLSDSSGSLRHHLSLLSGQVGKAGELLIDGSGLGLTFRDLSAAQDSLLQIGGSGGTTGTIVSSATTKFTDVLPGLSVTLSGQSLDPVTVSVEQTIDDAASAIQLFVDQYNKLRDKLDTYTAFDPVAGTKGTLFGSHETLRLDSELSRAITGSYFNDGSVRSLAELGVSVGENGKLAFDKTKLEARYAADPDAIAEFFADEEQGFAVKVDALLEKIVGVGDSLLLTRAGALQRQIEDVGGRIDAWNARLDRSRERLLLQFFRLEETVSRIQNNLSALNQIQALPPIQVSSGS